MGNLKNEGIGIVVSILMGLVYGLLTMQFGGANNTFEAITYGFFTAILCACLSLILIQASRGPQIQRLLKLIKQLSEDQREIIANFKHDQERVRQIRSNLNLKRILTKSVGFAVLDDYLDAITSSESGFEIKGEYWALKSYSKFWEHLVREQKIRKESSEANIIARITHSNDIRFWMRAHEFFSEELYLHQKEFIEVGGIVIRILIGPDAKPNQDYKKAIYEMEEIGIEVKYIQQRRQDSFSYDFLYLHDEGYVLQWYSGVNGQNLAKCAIQDRVPTSIRSHWRVLAERAEKEDSPLQNIPDGRNVY